MTDVDLSPADVQRLEGAAPPRNSRAEMAVLGAMMGSRDIADELAEMLTGEDFYEAKNGTIFEVIVDLAGNGTPPDALIVARALGDELGRVGGAAYLADCMEAPESVAAGPHYAGMVAELAVRRRILEGGATVQSLARNPAPVAEVVERAQQVIHDATYDRRDRTVITSVGDLVGPVMEHIEKVNSGLVESGIPTGLSEVDRVTGGFKPGQLWIPAARTGVGKSVITQNWIYHAVKATMRPGILFSVEMSTDEMMQRLLSQVARVPLTLIREGGMDSGDLRRLAEARDEILTLPLFMVDNCRTVPAVRTHCRRFVQKFGDLAIVGADYLQRFRPVGKQRDRHVEVGEFADLFKDLAQDMAMPVIAPCQLNRGPENRPGKEANKPKLSDLRESGNLEQTADVVALLFRPGYYDRNSPRAGEADIDLAKNRNGPTDTVVVKEELHFQRFVDLPVLPKWSAGEPPEPGRWD